MMILRFLGGVAALIAAFSLSLLTQIDLTSMLAMLSFVLVVDSLICKFLTYVYMKAVYGEMEKLQQDMMKKEKDKDGGNTGS